jgi:Pectate lyase
MKKLLLCFAVFVVAVMFSLPVIGQQLAFPGAEGFGRYSLGARGATTPTVYRVTNLNNSGSGSFRDAVSQPGRIVVFDVSGVIKITSRISISSNIYIAGQTAPGDGVVIYGDGISCSGGKDIIIRHMRFYMGRGGTSDADALTVANGESMIFDHLSVLWGKDENYSCNWDNKGTEPSKLTIQNSIVGQGLMTHSAGGLLRAKGGQSVIRCLYINSKTRNPNIREVAQFINNTVYNWSTDAFRFGGSGNVWLWAEGNYFISGSNGGGSPYASDGSNTAKQMWRNSANPDYADLNRDGVLNGSTTTSNGGSTQRNSLSEITGMPSGVTWPLFLENNMVGGILSAPDAHQYVINNVGATLPARTDIDDFLIDDLNKYGGSNSQKHIAEEKSNGIYNNVGLINNGQSWQRTAGFIPDWWKQEKELAVGTNWDTQVAPSGYLWLEEYINSIDGVTVKSGQPYLQASYRLRMGSRTPSSITLTWKNRQSDFDNVTLQKSTDGTTFTDVTTLSSSATTYTVTGLDEETFYTFRIISSKGGNSATSETFRVSTEGTPGVPLACSAAIHPENNGQSRFYTSVEFTWENETGEWSYPITYNVYFGKTPEDLVKINSSPVSGNMFDYRPSTPLEIGGKYYWRVDAVNAHGTAEGPVWNFTTSSMSFTENFIDLGRNFTPPSTFTDPKSGIVVPNSTSAQVTVNGDRVTFTRSGGSFGAASDNGVYRQSNNNVPTWRLPDSGNYVNIEPSNDQSKEKFISKVTINGTDASPGTSGRTMPVLLFSDKAPFDGSRILGYEQVTLSKCRGNVFNETTGAASGNHSEWEPPIIVSAPVGAKSVRIYHTIRLNELDSDGEDNIRYTIASNGDINLQTGGQARLSYFSVMLEHISNDGDPIASSVNTITAATINGTAATINHAASTITCKFPMGTVLGEMPVTFTLGSDKATANFTSGNTHNFANGPLAIEVTAEDGSKKTYTVSATVATKITVGILTADGQVAAYDEKFLLAFDEYDVRLLNAGTTAPTDINAFYDDCDLIVLHSNVGGANATAVATKSLVGIKPVLNMKAYFYSNGRWNWGTPNNTEIGRISATVPVVLQNHPIFSDVVFSGETLTLYGEPTTAINAFQYTAPLNGSAWTTAMNNANNTIATIDGDAAKINMHELNTNNAAKYLLIALSMEDNSYAKFNANAVTLLKNAAAYLLNPDVYYDYVTNTIISGLADNKMADIRFYPNPVKNELIIDNAELTINNTVAIYDIMGKQVNIQWINNKSINVSYLQKGVYILQIGEWRGRFVKE